MNKSVVFCLGLVSGVICGGVGTYYALKTTVVNSAKEEIENYAEHAEKRIEAIRQSYAERLNPTKKKEEPKTEPEEEDARINNNEGVKKYHHYDGETLPEYASKRVFAKREEKKVTPEEESKMLEEQDKKMKAEYPHISEVTEDEFLNAEDDYETATIDYFFDGHSERAFWGYDTDNQITVEAKYQKPLKELIGNAARWLIDYTDDTGVGAAYFQNDELKIIFEIIVHDSTGFNDRD